MLHTLHASKHSHDDDTVTVRSPDNDVFVSLLHLCQKIPQVFFDTGSADKQRLLDVIDIIADPGEDICMILAALHAFFFHCQYNVQLVSPTLRLEVFLFQRLCRIFLSMPI
jgi:hypothetical protein